jgi:aspartate aminotransferase
VKEYQKRRDALYEGLSKIPGVFLRKPEGAFYFVARLPVRDSDDFAAWLLTSFALEGKTVMVAPASGFYVTPGLGLDEVRIAYVLREEDLREAVRILSVALPAYRKAKGIGS